MLRIAGPAIRLRSGEVHEFPAPCRHSDVITKIYRLGFDAVGSVQGFIVSNEDEKNGYRTFLDRVEAYPVAEAAGQLLPKEARPGHEVTPGVLYTEDMW